MDDYRQRVSGVWVRVAQYCAQHPRIVVTSVVVLVLGSCVSILGLQPYFFEDSHGLENNDIDELSDFLDDFGVHEAAILSYACEAPACLLSPRELNRIEDLSVRLEAHPKVVSVRSLTRLPTILFDEDGSGLSQSYLIKQSGGTWPTRSAIEDKLEKASHPLVTSVVDASRMTTAIVVIFDLYMVKTSPPASASADELVDGHLSAKAARQGRMSIVGDLERIAAEHDDQDTAIDVHLAGSAVVATYATREYLRSAVWIVLGMMFVLTVLLGLIFRSVQGVLVPLVAIAVPTVWTLGLFALSGRSMGFLVPIVPSLILVIGMTDAVHLITRYLEHVGEGSPRADAMRLTVRELAWPCILTTLTTSIALGSLALSSLAPVREFGVLCALGLCFTFLSCFTLLPILLVHLDARPRTALLNSSTRWLESLQMVLRWKPWAVAVVAFFVIGVFGYGALKIEFNMGLDGIVGPGSDIDRAMHFVDTHLGTPDSYEVVLRAGEDDTFVTPEGVALLARVRQSVSEVQGVGRVWDPGLYLRWVYEELGRYDLVQDDAFKSRQGISQMRFLLDSVDPDELSRRMTSDGRVARVSGQLAYYPTMNETKVAIASIRRAVDSHLEGHPSIQYQVVGRALAQANATRELISTLAKSFSLSFAMVFLIFVWWMRSLRLALIAMIPNLIPVVVAMGWLGYAGQPIDLGTVVIASLIIGLAVDDTIHLTDLYLERTRSGDDTISAITKAFRSCARPILLTSVMLVMGFAMWSFATVRTVAHFGSISAIGIAAALVADIVVSPAVLQIANRRARHTMFVERDAVS